MNILATILAIVVFIAIFAMLFIVIFNIQKALCNDCYFKDCCAKDGHDDDFIPSCTKNQSSNFMNW